MICKNILFKFKINVVGSQAWASVPGGYRRYTVQTAATITILTIIINSIIIIIIIIVLFF